MAILHLDDVPREVYEQIQVLAAAHCCTPEAEAVRLLQQGLRAEPSGRSQAELLAELRRRSFMPPSGTPESVAWLREDRGR
jgi:plasmid stability protein